jgi:hypothetical protein
MRFIAAVALLAGCTPIPAYVPGSGRVLIGGPENSLRIEMVKSAEKNEVYFIRITGTDREYEGYVLRYTIDTSTPETHDWSTTIWGRERKPLRRDRANTDDPIYILRWRDGDPSTLTWAPEEKVDVEALLQLHLDQRNEIHALQAYDREREMKRHAKQWGHEVDRLNEACETSLTGDIAWGTLDDESMLVPWLGCGTPIAQLYDMCRSSAEARASINALERVVCRIGPELAISLEGKTLAWTAQLQPESGAHTFFKKALLNEVPWPDGPLEERIRVEEIHLCTDGKGNFVGLEQQPWQTSRVIYGQRGAWLRPRRVDDEVENDYFYDPRFIHPKLEPKRQRLSIVIADDHRCKLRCGERMTELQHVDVATKRELLLGATIVPAPLPRRPYGLARDRDGVYYYVDVGPKTDDRDFRVYAGRKGAMERLDMVDLVTDSGGDIFVTRTGKLRLILEKETSYWVEGSRTTDLINLPLEDNLLVIYNQLGVYLGQPYGTPCDVF